MEKSCLDDPGDKMGNKTVPILENASLKLQQWDETAIRQLVDTVKVISAEGILVYLRGGAVP